MKFMSEIITAEERKTKKMVVSAWVTNSDAKPPERNKPKDTRYDELEKIRINGLDKNKILAESISLRSHKRYKKEDK